VLLEISNSDADGEYLVDWDNVTGATSYWVEEDDNVAFSSPVVRYNGVDSQFQMSGQVTGEWFYRVRAHNAAGYGPWSDSQPVIVGPPAPVLDNIGNPDGDGEYLVNWSEITGAIGYELEEDDNSEFSSPTVIYDGLDSQFQVSGQETGEWFYRVRAYDADGPGLWSNTVWARVIPATPILAEIENNDGNGWYFVDWADVTGATGYELQEDDDPNFTSPTVRYIGPDSQYDVYGQYIGVWYYRVRASSTGGNSAWSVPISVQVEAMPYRVFLPLVLNASPGAP
jgi:hypothetical protein